MSFNIVSRLFELSGLDYFTGLFITGRVGYFVASVTLILAHMLSFVCTFIFLQYNSIIGLCIAVLLWISLIFLLRKYINSRL